MSSLNEKSTLKILFLTEAVLKVVGGATFLLFPTSILKNLTSTPHSPSSIALIRSFGTQTIAFSIPLFLTIQSDAKTRRLVYLTLLAREGCLAVGLLGQIVLSYIKEERADGARESGDARSLEEGRVVDVLGEKEDMRLEESNLRRGLWVWTAEVVPFVMARGWILWRGVRF